MFRFLPRLLVVLTVGLGLANHGLCTLAAAPQETDKELGDNLPDTVKGRLMGTDVNLKNAEYGRQLAVFEGEGWGFSPSLLIFLFLHDKKVPEGKVFQVAADAKPDFRNPTPHVHCRWRNPDTGEIDTEIASSKYNLRIEFGKIKDGILPGKLLFEIPDKKTRVAGQFQAKVKD